MGAKYRGWLSRDIRLSVVSFIVRVMDDVYEGFEPGAIASSDLLLAAAERLEQLAATVHTRWERPSDIELGFDAVVSPMAGLFRAAATADVVNEALVEAARKVVDVAAPEGSVFWHPSAGRAAAS